MHQLVVHAGLEHRQVLGTQATFQTVGGERAKAVFARLLASDCNLLVLDEPTNHISLALATELEEALLASAGTVLIASHDRWLRRRWRWRWRWI